MPRKIWGAFFLNASGQCTSHGSVSSNAFDTARDEASGHRSISPAPQALRLRLPPTAACSLWKSCLFFRLRTGRNEDLTPGTTGAAQLSVNRGYRPDCCKWGIHFIQVHPMGCGLAAPEQECEIARIVRVAAKPTHTRIHCGGSLRAATPRIGRATQPEPHAAPEQ